MSITFSLKSQFTAKHLTLAAHSLTCEPVNIGNRPRCPMLWSLTVPSSEARVLVALPWAQLVESVPGELPVIPEEHLQLELVI